VLVVDLAAKVEQAAALEDIRIQKYLFLLRQ
jgi:hypothetical protein